MQAETRVMQLQAKEYQGLLAATSSRKRQGMDKELGVEPTP